MLSASPQTLLIQSCITAPLRHYAEVAYFSRLQSL